MPRPLRVVLILLTALLGATAIPGGIALLVGFQAPPVALLRGSPFTDYTVPGLALLALVGGSAVLATVLLVRQHRFAAHGAIVAGIIVILFEAVEVMAIGSPAGPARVMQLFYVGVGIGLVGIAVVAMVRCTRASGRHLR